MMVYTIDILITYTPWALVYIYILYYIVIYSNNIVIIYIYIYIYICLFTGITDRHKWIQVNKKMIRR